MARHIIRLFRTDRGSNCRVRAVFVDISAHHFTTTKVSSIAISLKCFGLSFVVSVVSMTMTLTAIIVLCMETMPTLSGHRCGHPKPKPNPDPSFDNVTSSLMPAYRACLAWTVCLPTQMLIAQAVFLLKQGRTPLWSLLLRRPVLRRRDRLHRLVHRGAAGPAGFLSV